MMSLNILLNLLIYFLFSLIFFSLLINFYLFFILLIDDGVEERNQRYNLFHPDFKYIGIAAGPNREYGICVVIGYAMDVRPLGSEPKNVSDFIQEYIKNTMNRKKILNPFQEDAPDPPDNTVSLKIVKSTKTIGGKLKKITKKIFSLDNGAQHIIEIED